MPSPRLLLIPTFTATAAMGWDTDTEDTTVDTVLATTANVRPRLSPRLSPRLLLILTFTATEDTDWDTYMVLEDTTVDTVLATTASVRLRLSLRLLLIPGTMVDTVMVDTDSGLMDLDTDTVDSTMESKI